MRFLVIIAILGMILSGCSKDDGGGNGKRRCQNNYGGYGNSYDRYGYGSGYGQNYGYAGGGYDDRFEPRGNRCYDLQRRKYVNYNKYCGGGYYGSGANYRGNSYSQYNDPYCSSGNGRYYNDRGYMGQNYYRDPYGMQYQFGNFNYYGIPQGISAEARYCAQFNTYNRVYVVGRETSRGGAYCVELAMINPWIMSYNAGIPNFRAGAGFHFGAGVGIGY